MSEKNKRRQQNTLNPEENLAFEDLANGVTIQSIFVLLANAFWLSKV